MTYKIAIMAVGLSVSMLIGCGGGNDDGNLPGTPSTPGAGTIPNTIEEAKASILGTWESVCEYDAPNDASFVLEVTFRENDTLAFSGSKYPTNDCSGDSIGALSKEGTYKVGAKTKGSDEKEAFELETSVEEDGVVSTEYLMVRFTATILHFSIENEVTPQLDGKTPATRYNYFNADDLGFTKK